MAQILPKIQALSNTDIGGIDSIANRIPPSVSINEIVRKK